MNEMNHFEKQLQSWTPRHPSAKIAARLFGKTRETPAALLRRTELCRWLAPAAACVLTMLVIMTGTALHSTPYESRDNTTVFATFASSNGQHTFSLSKMDANVEWNVWSHATSVAWNETGGSLAHPASTPNTALTNRLVN